MILRRLTTRSFRNLIDGSIELHPSINVFVGDNGAGKTNLLEAIYVLATTRSFRTAKNQSLTRFENSDFFLRGEFDDAGLTRILSVGMSTGPDVKRRELLHNAQKMTITAYVRMVPVIAYSSARLEIIRGGPEERRRFIDRGVSDVVTGYLDRLTRYARVLKQRNALLQQGNGRSAPRELDTWDRELVGAGVEIVRARRAYIEELRKSVAGVVAEHEYHVDDLVFEYVPAGMEGDPEEDLARLRQVRPREIAAGFTLMGPHRDNLVFTRGGHAASEVLSSGELKMTVLFLKLARMRLLTGKRGTEPIFLLDDVDAELDPATIDRSMVQLGSGCQLFTTAPKEIVGTALSERAHARFSVAAGVVTALGAAPE